MTLEERLIKHRVIKDMGYITLCWIWTGAKSVKGYGRININGRNEYVHRTSAIIWLSNFNINLQACHKCDIKLCFNPNHLFQGNNSDNQKDLVQKGKHGNKKKTHCKKGHEFNTINTHIYKNTRVCLICKRSRT